MRSATTTTSRRGERKRIDRACVDEVRWPRRNRNLLRTNESRLALARLVLSGEVPLG